MVKKSLKSAENFQQIHEINQDGFSKTDQAKYSSREMGIG
jgi:hypothetical protein